MKQGHVLAMFAGAIMAVQFGPTGSGMAQQAGGDKMKPPALMKVDWEALEIKKFIRERSSNPPQSLRATDESKLAKLKLPVIAFDRPPGVVRRAFGVERSPKRKRTLITDPDNPNWYTLVDEYGELTITVEADLRVQLELPANVKVYTPPPSLTATPKISIIDRKVEEGMEGLIAEYTVRKFPDIPYRITIECTRATKQHCSDSEALLRDRNALRIISARPPN